MGFKTLRPFSSHSLNINSSGNPKSQGSILARYSYSVDTKSPELKTIQTQVDGMVSSFVDQATEWKSLAAMMAGGIAYRIGRIGFLSAASRLPTSVQKVPFLIRGASTLFGLTNEVTAYEAMHRGLVSLSLEGEDRGEGASRNLWNWTGKGGLKEGWFSSFVTFGTLKGFGKLGEGQNIILQHGVQDAGMVLGHQLLFKTGLGEKPEGTLAEQLLHAEVTNLQMGAGMALGHSLSGGKIQAIEKGLDLGAQGKESEFRGPQNLSLHPFPFAPAMAWKPEGRQKPPPHLLMAENKEGESEISKIDAREPQKSEKVLHLWRPDRASLKEAITWILSEYFKGDPSPIRLHRDFTLQNFKLPDGKLVTGMQIIRSVARLERPDLGAVQAVKALGGTKKVVEILKRTYLDEKPWDYDLETFKKALVYVFSTHLEGNPHNIDNSESFWRREFVLPQGTVVTGQKFANTLARLEVPGMTTPKAIEKLGGTRGMMELLIRKYLYVNTWDSSKETVKKTFQYVVKTYLGGNPALISTSPNFTERKFKLPDGEEVRGQRLLLAVAKLEHPSVNGLDSMKVLGGAARVVELVVENYLTQRPWNYDESTLKKNLKFIFMKDLNGDINAIASTDRYTRRKFKLLHGEEVSGYETLTSVARLERPDLPALEAVKTLGRTRLIEILHLKYLERIPWDYNAESLSKAIQYVLSKYLDGEPDRIRGSTEFLSGRFRLQDGVTVSGRQILRAVAQLENPELELKEAVAVLGTHRQTIKILKEKYLKSAQKDNPPSSGDENKGQPIPLKMGRGLDWEGKSDAKLPLLEAILKEIVDSQFGGKVEDVSSRKIRETSYLNPEAVIVSGEKILRLYSWMRWIKNHPGGKIPTLEAVTLRKRYSQSASLDVFLKETYQYQKEVVAAYTLRSTAEYSWESGTKIELPVLEEILKEIFSLQFKKDPEEFFSKKILETWYQNPEGTQIHGGTLLRYYAHARWAKDHPGEANISQAQAITKKGYSLSESIKFFRSKVLGYSEKGDFQLESGKDYDWSKYAKPNLALLQEILREILETQFENQIEEMKVRTLVDTYYLNPAGRRINGYTLLRHYCYSRWQRDHPDEKDIGVVRVSKLAGYTPLASLEDFKAKILGFELAQKGDISLESAENFLSARQTAIETPEMEQILKEILDVQFHGDVNKMTVLAMKNTRYQFPKGNILNGKTVLGHYSKARWNRDHPHERGLPRMNVIKAKGYFYIDSLKYFFREVMGHRPQVKADYTLKSALGYDWSHKAPPNLKNLEKILREILVLQFGNDPAQMNAGAIYTTTYKGTDNQEIKGTALLNHYSHARWLRDHPGKPDIGRAKVPREAGYMPADSIEYFLRNFLKYEPDFDYVLSTSGVYDWSLDQKPPLPYLEEALKEIISLQFASDPKRIVLHALERARFRVDAGRVISGLTILKRYSYARWLEDHPPSLTLEEALNTPGYRNVDSLEYLMRNVLGFVDFDKTSQEELKTFIQKAGLSNILDLFSEDPALLTEALAFLKKTEFENKDISDFVRAYVGLQVEREGKGEGAKVEIDSWEKRRKYLLAIVQALETGEKLDLSEVNFQNQLNLLILLSRKSFEEAPLRLMEELEKLSQQSTHPFVQRLQSQAAQYFRKTNNFNILGMRTRPYAYQKEGAHFLAIHDRAILADEAGMGKSYQVIAGAESLGLKRVLWITTASNKETLREEILTHSNTKYQDVKIVISGNPRERKEQIQTLNGERYIITNYETLVALQKADPEGYAKLTKSLDIIVVDEAQLTDNPETLRTKAIHDIPSPRRWLLTATPYQSKPEKMWTLLNWLDPEKYPDSNAFKQMYTQSTQGLILLHSELSKVMLRRTKKDTLSYFKPSSELPFEQQLADGIPRLPRKIRLTPEQSGTYVLSPEQADLIAWMTADFKGWVEYYNSHLPNGSEPINPGNINSLLKFDMIQKVIYEPEHFWITTKNPIFESLDKILARRLAQGEKVILWGWNTSMIDALEKRYEKLGLRRIDGSVTGNPREQARHDFQENPHVRILVANYQSGGVGLTLTGAHSAIFVQLPAMYPLLYQAEGRHQRLIGPNNLRHAKSQVEVEWMVPRFPPEFLERIENAELAEILSHGTLVEQTRSRLEGGEILYNLLMEGYGNLEEFENHFKAGLIQGMGLDREEKLDYVSHLKGDIRAYAEVTRDLLPLWKLIKGNAEAEEKVLHFIESFKAYPLVAKKIGEAFQNTSRAYSEDLDFISSLFNLKNKHIRQQMLERVPDLIVKIYGQGKSLKEGTEGLKMGRLTPASFLAQVYTTSGAGGKVVVDVTRELSEQRDTPVKRYLEEHFFSGVFGIMGNKVAEEIVGRGDPRDRPREGRIQDSPLQNKIYTLYRLGLITRTRPDLLEPFRGESFDNYEGFSKKLEKATHQAIAEFAGRSREQVAEMLVKNPQWINADPLLALIAGYRENHETVLLGQFAEVIGHLLDGDFKEWRNGPKSRYQGYGIEYLKEEKDFWDEFSKNQISSLDEVKVSTQKVHATLLKDYLALVEEFRQEGASVEGSWVKEQIEAYRSAKGEEKTKLFEQYQDEVRTLGKTLGSHEPNQDLAQKAGLQQKITELKNLIAWMNLDQSFQALMKNQNVDKALLIRELDLKVKFYRSRKYDKMAEHLETLKEALVRYQSGELTFKDITIEDTDDPALLTRMGALHPEMTNCFNPNGNPIFNQFVVSALGSKNMKMVVVREEGKIVAVAMAKVKQAEDGKPVLFLENGLYRKGYDFRQEMLAHLFQKAQAMSHRPVVMDEVPGRRPKENDPVVLGIGAYTKSEYVESVFGLREAKYVKHRGRIYQQNPPTPPFAKGGQLSFLPPLEKGGLEPLQGPGGISIGEGDRMTSTIGIGTSNKTIEAYLQELKDQGVSTVVDVRGTPFSRFYPHFNKEKLAVALGKEGILYIWLGDSLGNPKDSQGNRTLEGFQDYMKTETYQQGLTRLMEFLRRAPGKVALTCAEGAEEACHRKFILEDLRKIIKGRY